MEMPFYYCAQVFHRIASVALVISIASCIHSQDVCTGATKKHDIRFAVLYPQLHIEEERAFKAADGSTILHTMPNATETICYTLRFTLTTDDFHGYEFMNATRSKFFDEMPDLRGIVGAHRKAVENYAVARGFPYILSMPLDSEVEARRLARHLYRDVMIHMWPSPRNLADAIITYLIQNKLTNVHVLYGGEVDRLRLPVFLMSALEQNDLIEHVGSSYIPVEWKDTQDAYYNAELESIISDIKATSVNTFIVTLFNDDPIPILKEIFSKSNGLDRTGTHVIIADMARNANTTIVPKLADIELNQANLILIGPYQLRPTPNKAGESMLYDIIAVIVRGIEGSTLDISKNNSNLVEALRHVTFDAFVSQCASSGELIYQAVGFNIRDGLRNQFTLLFTKLKIKVTKKSKTINTIVTDAYSTCIPDDYAYNSSVCASNQEVLVCGRKKTNKVKILVVVDPPFIIKRPGLGGNFIFEGAGIDILNQIRIELIDIGKKLEYDITEEERYGVNNDGVWNGAIGKLTVQEAGKVSEFQMAVGSFSKTATRMEVVQFTHGFASTGISFVYRKEAVQSYVRFMKPLHLYVWLAILGVIIVSTLVVYGFDQWNPMQNNFGKRDKYSLSESVWLAYCTINQTGTMFAPYQIPTRVFTVFLWFFTLIVVASYTANLASFLTSKAYSNPDLGSIRSLATRYGPTLWTISDSSIKSFFRDSDVQEYNNIHKRLLYATNISRGLQIIKTSHNDLFLGDSITLHYNKGQDETCSLAQSEEVIEVTSIGFPMAKDWNLAQDFNTALLKLKEDGVIPNILNKWFKLSSKCGKASDDSLITLDWTHFIGLYIILGVGILVSFVLLAMKLTYLWRRDKKTQEHDLSTPVQSTINLAEYKNSNNPSTYFEDRGYTNPGMNNLTGSPRHASHTYNATSDPDQLLY